MTAPRAFTFTVPLPTWGLNEERARHWRVHRRLTDEFRGQARIMALHARIPTLDRIAVEVTPFGPLIRQDVGAVAGPCKAAIDGLRDAKVIVDDTPKHVTRITYHPPRRGPHGLHLLIVDLADLPPDFGTYQAALALDA